jgi:hypothetical protein
MQLTIMELISTKSPTPDPLANCQQLGGHCQQLGAGFQIAQLPPQRYQIKGF